MEKWILSLIGVCSLGYLIYYFKKVVTKKDCTSCIGNCASCLNKNK